MDLDEIVQEGSLVLRPKGRLASDNCDDFERIVRSRIEAGSTRIVFDFVDLTYISSAGLRVVLISAKLLKAKNGTIAICRSNETVDKVFQIAGFSSILAVHRTLDEALSG